MNHFKQKRAVASACLALSALIFTASTALAPTQAQAQLPMMGDGMEMTANAERRLGEQIVRSLYRDPDYLDDPQLQEYVQRLFDRLRSAARARGELAPEIDEGFAWELLLGRDRTVNAFALPGGFFGVHLGLIAVVATGDELASVLAHELSHVTQRHISRLIAQQGRQTPLMLGALILGALAASRSPDAAQALAVGGSALAVQNQLNFSRDMEREADRVGYGLMAPAGFAPQGFVAMFDTLQQANRINDNGSWPYLRSHPLTTQRIADMHARLPLEGGAPPPAATLEHAMLVARARVLMRPGQDALRLWLAEPQSSGFAAQPRAQQVLAWYAASLSALQLNHPDAALQAWSGLWRSVQGDATAMRQARLLAAELELAAGDAQAALAQLAPLGQRARPELLLATQALLATGGAAPMAERLQTWLATHPRDAAAWQLLAQVWQRAGEPLRAVRAEAEAQAAHYDWSAAIDRFKAGQDLARRANGAQDHIDASIIDTRLRAVQSLAREQAAER